MLLVGATILLAVAKATWILVISRTLQGLSAAVTYTVGLALLVDTVGRENIGQYMGTALSASSFGLIVSPLAGGIIYNTAGYTAVFSVAIAVAVVDILMRLSMIEKRKVEKHVSQGISDNGASGYNTFQNASGIVSEGSTSSDEADNDPSGSAPHVHFPAHHETSTLVNKRHDARKGKGRERSKPVIFRLLASPRLLAAIYGIFVNVGILATFDGVLPLFVKETFHWNSLNAGLIFLCLAIPALAGPIVGALSDRVGPRWIAVGGCTLTTIPLILMRLVEKNTVEQKILLCCLLFLSGMSANILASSFVWWLIACIFTLGCTLICIVSPVAADLSAVVEEMEEDNPGSFGPGGAYAQAYALFNCAMAGATLFGPMAFGALRQDYGWKVTTLCMGIFSLSGAIPSVS